MCQGWETLIQSHRVGVKISWDHICKALSTVSIKYSITEILLQLSQENGNQTYSQELIDQQSYLHHTSLLILLTSLLLRLIFPAVLWMPSLAPSFISTLFLCSVFNFSLFTASFPSFWKYTQGSLKYINACDSFPLTRALSPFLTQLVGGTLPTLLLPGGSAVKNLTAKQETGFNPWVRKIPWRRKLQPTPVFLPGKSYGQRSQAGYSPWGRKQSDTTGQLTTTTTLITVLLPIISSVSCCTLASSLTALLKQLLLRTWILIILQHLTLLPIFSLKLSLALISVNTPFSLPVWFFLLCLLSFFLCLLFKHQYSPPMSLECTFLFFLLCVLLLVLCSLLGWSITSHSISCYLHAHRSHILSGAWLSFF